MRQLRAHDEEVEPASKPLGFTVVAFDTFISLATNTPQALGSGKAVWARGEKVKLSLQVQSCNKSLGTLRLRDGTRMPQIYLYMSPSA